MSTPPESSTRVWDFPVRLFHWALVICIAGSWISAEVGFNGMTWHTRFGYAALTLILFRLGWGFFGGRHARFGDFLRGPATVLRYFPTMFRRHRSPYLGHNPLGGLSVLVMLVLVLVQAVTGLFADDDIFFEGPLNGWVSNKTADLLTSIHHLNFNLLIAIIAIHIVAVLWYWVWKRQNLVWPMVTGYKRESAEPPAPPVPWWRAPVWFVVCVGAVAALVTAPEWIG